MPRSAPEPVRVNHPLEQRRPLRSGNHPGGSHWVITGTPGTLAASGKPCHRVDVVPDGPDHSGGTSGKPSPGLSPPSHVRALPLLERQGPVMTGANVPTRRSAVAIATSDARARRAAPPGTPARARRRIALGRMAVAPTTRRVRERLPRESASGHGNRAVARAPPFLASSSPTIRLEDRRRSASTSPRAAAAPACLRPAPDAAANAWCSYAAPAAFGANVAGAPGSA